MELIILGKRVYIEPYLVARQKKIQCTKGTMFNSMKIPKLKNIEMANKICGPKKNLECCRKYQYKLSRVKLKL